MNPAETAKAPIRDIAGPASVGAPPAVVDNIPVRAPVPDAAVPDKDDDELDRIMRDVGHELKKEDAKPAKTRRGLFRTGRPKSRTEARLHAQPLTPRPITGRDIAPPPEALPQARPPAAMPAKAPVVVSPKPKPPKTGSAPVLAITMAIIVTMVLIGAAYYAYKK